VNRYRPDPATMEYFQGFPKVELHRHLEGSVTPEILWEVASRYGVSLPTRNLNELRRAIQIDGRVSSLKEFLDRFYLLGLAFPTLEAVEEVSRLVCRQCAREGIYLVELRFSPVFMTLEQGHHWGEMIEAIVSGVAAARREAEIEVGLIVGVSRSNPVERALEVVELAERFRGRGVVGLDLFGDEDAYPPEIFSQPFRAAREKKLNITVHAGEGGGETNIRTAVETLGASRIGHGVRVIRDPDLVKWVRDRGVSLEICLTSNVHTCTVPSLSEHPVREIFDAGIKISLNTDDPAISKTTLSEEYALAAEVFGFTPRELRSLVLTALEQSFLPAAAKARAGARIRAALEKFPDALPGRDAGCSAIS